MSTPREAQAKSYFRRGMEEGRRRRMNTRFDIQTMAVLRLLVPHILESRNHICHDKLCFPWPHVQGLSRHCRHPFR